MARMRPVLFSSTTTAPCTTGRTRSSARAPALALAVGHANQDDIVKRKLALSDCVVDGERKDAAVSQADPPRLALLAVARLLHDDRGRPVHVVERQSRARQRLLPGRPLVAGFLLRFGALDGLGQLRLRGHELHPPGAALIAREPLLQRRLHRPLQLRIDRRAHGVGVGGDRLDACQRFGLARDLIHEVEADIAPRPLVGHHCRQRRQSAAGLLLRGIGLVLLHAAENISEPFLRASGMPVGIEIVRPLGQAGQQRALLQGQILRLLAEIAAGRELDPPGAAAEIDRIEVELEDLRLAQRVLDPRGHDHLADLAVIGEVLADQEVLHDLLGDGRAALRAPGLREVADEGADQAALVDAFVPIEALVLGREERLLDVFRDVGERNPLRAAGSPRTPPRSVRPCGRARRSRPEV